MQSGPVHQRGVQPFLLSARTVGHAAKVIAVFDGKKSGTKNTIDYAGRVGVSVIRIEG